MDSYKRQTVLDRRTAENLYLSILVDLAVTYKRTLGQESARMFFSAHEIPPPVVTRILASDCPRRLTEWEECAKRVEADREIKP